MSLWNWFDASSITTIKTALAAASGARYCNKSRRTPNTIRWSHNTRHNNCVLQQNLHSRALLVWLSFGARAIERVWFAIVYLCGVYISAVVRINHHWWLTINLPFALINPGGRPQQPSTLKRTFWCVKLMNEDFCFTQLHHWLHRSACVDVRTVADYHQQSVFRMPKGQRNTVASIVLTISQHRTKVSACNVDW